MQFLNQACGLFVTSDERRNTSASLIPAWMSTIASFRLLQALPTELRWNLTSTTTFASYKRFVSTAAEQEALIEEQAQRHVTRGPAQRDPSAFVPPRLHAFTGSPKFRDMLTHASNPLEVLMQELDRVASNGRVIATLQICKEIQKRIVFDRRTPSRPDIRVYKALLQAFGSQGYVAECERTVDDMLDVGISPDTAIYNLWLQVRTSSICGQRRLIRFVVGRTSLWSLSSPGLGLYAIPTSSLRCLHLSAFGHVLLRPAESGACNAAGL